MRTEGKTTQMRKQQMKKQNAKSKIIYFSAFIYLFIFSD